MEGVSPLANKYRRHRECFELAMKMGCTPHEAECELKRREGNARWAATEERLKAAQVAPQGVRLADLPDERWMMRD